MLIKTKTQTKKPGRTWGASAKRKPNPALEYLKREPIKVTTAAVDVAVLTPLAFGAHLGTGGGLQVVAGVVAGAHAIHGAMKVSNAMVAKEFGDEGVSKARKFGVQAAGEAMKTLGLGLAAVGITGPLPIGVAVAGIVTSHLSS